MIDKLAAIGILSRKTDEKTMLEEIVLNTNIDELCFALKSAYDDFEELAANAEENGKLANAKMRPGRKLAGESYKND